jgi:hypothetical protein
MVKGKPMAMMQRRSVVRQAANPMSYRKVITERSFEKDYRPRDPRVVYPRMRQLAAMANR